MKFVWPDSFIKVYATAKHLSPGDWWMLWRYSAQKISRNIWRKQRFFVGQLEVNCWIFNGLTVAESGDFPKSFNHFPNMGVSRN